LIGANLFYKKNPPKSSVILNPSRDTGPTTLTIRLLKNVLKNEPAGLQTTFRMKKILICPEQAIKQ